MKKVFVLLLASLLLASCAGEAEVGLVPTESLADVSSGTEFLENASSADEPIEDALSDIESAEEPIEPIVPEHPHGSAFVTGQTEELDFEVQRIGAQDDGDDLDVDILTSVAEKEALLSFYDTEKDHYDEAYFENRSLIAFRITHGSGSIRDTVEKVVLREDGTVEVHVAVYYPEMGTCDMAYRYYLIETEEDYLINADNPVELYINDELKLSFAGAHEHVYLQEPIEGEPLEEQIHSTGSNTYVKRGEACRMQNSTLGDRLCEIIGSLEYTEENLCSCESDILIDCRFGYHFMLDLQKGFVRYGKQQASMTKEQADELAAIIKEILTDESYGRFSYREETGHWSADTYGVVLEGFVNTEPCELSSATQAIEHAKNDCTVAYEYASADYDDQADVWRIIFYKQGTGKRLRVYMTGDGVTLMTRYSW